MIRQYRQATRTPARALYSASISNSELFKRAIWKPYSGCCIRFNCFDSLTAVKSFNPTDRFLIGGFESQNKPRFGSTFICNSEKKSFSGETVKLYFDGGSRGNPGPGGSGSYLENDNGQCIWQGHSFLGVVTNNQAEYDGLIKGLIAAKEAGIKNLKVFGDSKLVIEQMKGNWAVKAERLIPLHAKANSLISYFNHVSFQFVKRELNGVADGLVNIAINCEGDQSQWGH